MGRLQKGASEPQIPGVAHLFGVAKPAPLAWDVAGSLYVTPMAGLAGVRAVAPEVGEVVAISGASGGVGFVSAQLALRTDAAVIGLASPDNAGWLAERGVIPVAYGEGQEKRVRAAAGGRRIDAFIGAVGSGYVDLALASGVPKERINTVVDFGAARKHGVTTMGTREAGGVLALQELADLAASGMPEIPIARVYPLDEVKDAYRDLEP